MINEQNEPTGYKDTSVELQRFCNIVHCMARVVSTSCRAFEQIRSNSTRWISWSVDGIWVWAFYYCVKQTVLRFLAVSITVSHAISFFAVWQIYASNYNDLFLYNRIVSSLFLIIIIIISDNSFGQSSSITHQILSGKQSVVYLLFLPGTFTSVIPVYLFSRLRTFHVNRIKGRVLSVSQHSLYYGLVCLLALKKNTDISQHFFKSMSPDVWVHSLFCRMCLISLEAFR